MKQSIHLSACVCLLLSVSLVVRAQKPELVVQTGHTVSVVTFSSDGKTLASGSNDGTIKLWDVANLQQLRTLGDCNSLAPKPIGFSPDGKMLASGCHKLIKLWDVSSGQELRTLAGHDDQVNSVAFSPDGKTLASGGHDQTIKLWDVASGRELCTLVGHTASVQSVTFSPDGRTLASGGYDQTIRLWDVSSGQQSLTLKDTDWVDSAMWSPGVGSVAFSPDGKTLASGSADKTVKLWDTMSGRQLRTLAGHTGYIVSVALSPDGKIIASGSFDDTIKLWDVASGQEIRTLNGWGGSVAFSPNGKTLASPHKTTIKLWEVTSGQELRPLTGHTEGITSVDISPDSKMIISGGMDKTIKVWDVSGGQELRTLKGHTSWVRSVAISPDGKTLASWGTDEKIKLWDAQSGQLRESLYAGDNLDKVRQLGFPLSKIEFPKESDKFVAHVGGNGIVKLLDRKTGEELCSLIALDDNDWLIVTPDGLFDGSPAAWNKIIWRFNNNTFNHAPVEAFFGDFYYPGLLADIFAGKWPKAPADIARKDRRQPQLKLTQDASQAVAAGAARNVTVRLEVAQAPAGAQDVRLLRNGSLVKVWRGDVLKGRSSVVLEATLPIVAGENTLTAYAFNRDNIKSADATMIINGAESLRRKGTAHVVAVGVNQYAANPFFRNLRYAVADAAEFAAEVKRQQEQLAQYERVEVLSLTDSAATKANVLGALARLAEKVQPEDAVVIYFAGHGLAEGGRFYVIPHDIGEGSTARPADERAALDSMLAARGISDQELEQAFEGVDAGQLTMIIDACNSGQALGGERDGRGPMNSKGLAQLAYDKGMYILTAAQSFQAAQEASQLGHGLLTYALIEEGLRQATADGEPKDGQIVVREWLDYATNRVPTMQIDQMKKARGRGINLSFKEEERGLHVDRRSGQQPRVFYRRELEAHPLVVAKPGVARPNLK